MSEKRACTCVHMAEGQAAAAGRPCPVHSRPPTGRYRLWRRAIAPNPHATESWEGFRTYRSRRRARLAAWWLTKAGREHIALPDGESPSN